MPDLTVMHKKTLHRPNSLKSLAMTKHSDISVEDAV